MNCISILLSILLTLTISDLSFSKGFSGGGGGGRSYSGGSSYSSRSYSNSRPSRSYSTPSPSRSYSNSASKPAAIQPSKPSMGYGNSGGAKSAIRPTSNIPKTAMQSRMNTGVSKAESSKALSSYKAEQSKFKAPPSNYHYSNSSRQTAYRTVNVYHVTPQTYYVHRNSFYSGYHYSTPFYAYNTYSYFGMWDAMALWFMLDHIGNGNQYNMMYYNHQNDPDMIQWRNEANRLAQDNSELRSKLNQLDNQTNGLSGQAKDPNYIPPNMKDVALSSKAVEDANNQNPPDQMTPVPPPKPESHLLRNIGIGVVVTAIIVIGWIAL